MPQRFVIFDTTSVGITCSTCSATTRSDACKHVKGRPLIHRLAGTEPSPGPWL